MFDFGFLMFDEGADVGRGPTSLQTLLRSGGASKGADADFSPRLRDALARGFLMFDEVSPAGCTTRRALWPRSRKAFVKRPRSRCQKSWSGRMERSV